MKHWQLLYFIFLCISSDIQAETIKKWIDDSGKIHFGDRTTAAVRAETIEIDNPAPVVTEGERLMRENNQKYFAREEKRRMKIRKAKAKQFEKHRKKLIKQERQAKKKRFSDERACIKARLKIKDIEDDLRDGYSTARGVKLEKNRRKQKRRVDAYC